MIRNLLLALPLFCAALASAAPLPSEIAVKLEPDTRFYLLGERMRMVIDVANSSVDSLDVGSRGSEDRLFVELFRAADRERVPHAGGKLPFTAAFTLHSSEGQRLETRLGDHFVFDKPMRYLARAVLVHAGIRYESALKSFDVVPGLRTGGALQMFAEKPGLKREFELVHWGRYQVEHLFLRTRDMTPDGKVTHTWTTADLGPYLSVTPPKLSVLPSGEVIVLHRATQDVFIRTVFWSLPEAFEFNEHEQMTDPDIAGAKRVKELYDEAGGVEPVKKAWWKFW